MGVYKTLTPSDITRVPFDANKLYTFNSSSATNVGIGFQKFEFVSSSLDSYSSVSTDTSSSIRYHQLDHLFYKNHRLDISNKLGDADYLNQFRTLHRRANVINIPSGLFGNRIKQGTFQITGSGWNIVDDKKGNLIISGAQLADYNIDEREKVFSLGPVKGFKKYDLKAHFYGENNPEPDTHYSKENVNDDSYYTNTLDYKNILFSEEVGSPVVNFIGTSTVSSSIVAPHNELYNFNPDENFAISMYINPKKVSGHVVGKSTTKSLIKEATNTKLHTTGSSQLFKTTEKENYPFEVFLNEETNNQGTFQLINFRRSDGKDTPHISCSLSQNTTSHVVCMKSGSMMSIYIDGGLQITEIDSTSKQTENQANLYIGSKGEISDYFSGSIANLMIFNQHRTNNQISNLYNKSDGTPYVGNIFYSNGIAVITDPNYQHVAKPHASNDYLIKFKSINTIYENEYMCTIRSDEYNYTHNISTRKIKSDQHPTLANFATGSIWKPYVTTIGLYNEEGELLIVGKLGQPVRMSDETDTTFVIRYDN
jgi:hypothetical protein